MEKQFNYYNEKIQPLIKIIDKENGEGYAQANIKARGYLLKLPSSNTQMLYEVKMIDDVIAVYIRYIHYDNKTELLNLLAFTCQWWRQLKPHLVYYREKERRNSAGEYLLEKLGFIGSSVKNELKPFKCLRDGGNPCKCKVNEYIAYQTTRKKKQHPIADKIIK